MQTIVKRRRSEKANCARANKAGRGFVVLFWQTLLATKKNRGRERLLMADINPLSRRLSFFCSFLSALIDKSGSNPGLFLFFAGR